MPSINNSPASGRTPCRKGQIRTKVIQYRCINNETFHDKLVNKINNASPRSSRRKSSPRSSNKIKPRSNNLRKPSILNEINRFDKKNLKRVRSPKPSIFNEINRFDKKTLKRVRSPKPSILNEINRFDKKTLKRVRSPKPSIINEISRFNKKTLKPATLRSKSPTKIPQGILKSTNQNFNNFRKQLLSRRKILKNNSGSDNNSDEWRS
jgi:hypothetical protein